MGGQFPFPHLGARFLWGVITELAKNLMEYGKYKIKMGLQNAPVMAEQMTLFGVGGRHRSMSWMMPSRPCFNA